MRCGVCKGPIYIDAGSAYLSGSGRCSCCKRYVCGACRVLDRDLCKQCDENCGMNNVREFCTALPDPEELK